MPDTVVEAAELTTELVKQGDVPGAHVAKNVLSTGFSFEARGGVTHGQFDKGA